MAEPPGLSAFTPFLRRFTDEKARDLSDTRELYRQVEAQHRASHFADPEARTKVGGVIYSDFNEIIPEPLVPIFCQTLDRILSLETAIFDLPSQNFDIAHLSLKEQVDLRRFLRSKQHFLAHEDRVLDLLLQGASRILGAVARGLPVPAQASPFTIPLAYALPDAKALIDGIYAVLWEQPFVDNGIFVEISRRLYLNLCEISGIVDPHDPKKPFKYASKNDAPLDEVVKQYLGGTPFLDLFAAPVPLRFSHEDRFSHAHVVGGSGAGKTTLLQNLILHDLLSGEWEPGRCGEPGR